MNLTEWSADTLQYDLSDEYSIRLADVTEWGLFCTIYYDMGYVGFFQEEQFSSARCSAYWIYQGENKIGGVRMEPNQMYHLFLIPPFQQGFEIVKLLKQKLMQWSDRSKRILTFEVLPGQVDWFASGVLANRVQMPLDAAPYGSFRSGLGQQGDREKSRDN